MFTAERYVRPATLQEALELNRKRSSTILGGGCWLRLGRKRIGTLIDLSGLGLDQIEERDGWVRIGAMVSLRQLETSALLKERFGSLFADMTGHIVGVQFRECATFGGSVWDGSVFRISSPGSWRWTVKWNWQRPDGFRSGTSLPGRQTGIFWRQSGYSWTDGRQYTILCAMPVPTSRCWPVLFPAGKGKPLIA